MRSTSSNHVPRRLSVYRALCELSPEAYAPLARMILSTARDDEHASAHKLEDPRGRHQTLGHGTAALARIQT